MKWHILWGVVAAVIVSPIAQADDADTWVALLGQYQAQQVRCGHLYKVHRLRTYGAFIRCSDVGVYASFSQADFPYMDVIDLMTARHAVIAEQVDTHKISRAEADLDLAQLGAHLTAMMEQHLAAKADAEALQRQDQKQAKQQADGQREADERRRQALLCYSAGLSAPGFGTAAGNIGYANMAYAECLAGRPMPALPQGPAIVVEQAPASTPSPPQSRTTGTYCRPSGDGVVCTDY